jgi:hypothetical protein
MISKAMAQAMNMAELANAGVRYCWIIDEEYTREFVHEDWRRDGKWGPIEDGEVIGPSGVTDEEIDNARNKGVPFRLDYDGDGPALRGRMWTSDARHARDSEAAFQPLEDFGEPSYGCTTILYRNDQKKWEEL